MFIARLVNTGKPFFSSRTRLDNYWLEFSNHTLQTDKAAEQPKE